MAADGDTDFHGCWSVFFDFCCIHQCCRDREGVPQQRTYRWLSEGERFAESAMGRFESEDVLFKDALNFMGKMLRKQPDSLTAWATQHKPPPLLW